MNNVTRHLILTIFFATSLISADRIMAHCDGLDGPVVKAAQAALATGNLNLAMIWVRKADEPEIIRAFEQTLAVRKSSAEARQLADIYFFETLVRIHRAGEGAPYTGLKPAGRDLGSAIPAADLAIANSDIEALLELIRHAVANGTQERFHQVIAKGDYKKDDVEAGREFVKAYVEFIHYVERLYDAASQSAADHGHESEH